MTHGVYFGGLGRAVMKAIANGLGQVLTRAAQLATLWKGIEPYVLK
jgi:hypothetical protein